MTDFHRHIEYTLLKPDATEQQIELLCDEALLEEYWAVCVPPCHVRIAWQHVLSSPVRLCTVVGFPLGYNSTRAKLAECETVIHDGAQEIDMVVNLSEFKSGHLHFVEDEIMKLRGLTRECKVTLKVIVETGFLNAQEIESLCRICTEQEVDFVKTSTGFSTIGAELDKVVLMRQLLPPNIGIKASGGIRSVDAATSFILAGASRIGTSARLKQEGDKTRKQWPELDY